MKQEQATKAVTLKSGSYQGKQAEILGTDIDLFGTSVMILSKDNQAARDYVKRITTDFLPLSKNVFAAKIDGDMVFINESELSNVKN